MDVSQKHHVVALEPLEWVAVASFARHPILQLGVNDRSVEQSDLVRHILREVRHAGKWRQLFNGAAFH